MGTTALRVGVVFVVLSVLVSGVVVLLLCCVCVCVCVFLVWLMRVVCVADDAGCVKTGQNVGVDSSVCPSGLRGYVQVVMFSNSWVQIPQPTFCHTFCTHPTPRHHNTHTHTHTTSPCPHYPGYVRPSLCRLLSVARHPMDCS